MTELVTGSWEHIERPFPEQLPIRLTKDAFLEAAAGSNHLTFEVCFNLFDHSRFVVGSSQQ